MIPNSCGRVMSWCCTLDGTESTLMVTGRTPARVLLKDATMVELMTLWREASCASWAATLLLTFSSSLAMNRTKKSSQSMAYQFNSSHNNNKSHWEKAYMGWVLYMDQISHYRFPPSIWKHPPSYLSVHYQANLACPHRSRGNLLEVPSKSSFEQGNVCPCLPVGSFQ